MADISWPAELRPSDGGFWLENPSRSGGVAFAGIEQNVFSMAMRWRARFTFPVRTKAQVLAARTLAAKAQGKAGTILVPFFDGKRISWPKDQWGRTLHPGFTRRRQLDGTIYEDPAIPDQSEVIATLISSAALRDTTVEVFIEQGEPPLAGQYFGLGGARGYLIHDVGTISGDSFALTFWPPLRAAASSSDDVDFTRPVCRMNQIADDQGIGPLDAMVRTDLTMEFVESF